MKHPVRVKQQFFLRKTSEKSVETPCQGHPSLFAVKSLQLGVCINTGKTYRLGIIVISRIFSLLQQLAPPGFRNIFIIIRTMLAAVAAAIPAGKMVLFGQNNIAVIVVVIIVVFVKRLLHVFVLAFPSVQHLFLQSVIHPATKSTNNECDCFAQCPTLRNVFL